MAPKRIVMYTRVDCEDSDAAWEFLRQRHLLFEEADIEKDPKALELVMRVNEGKRRTLTFHVDARTFHRSQFDTRKLARELDLPDPTEN